MRLGSSMLCVVLPLLLWQASSCHSTKSGPSNSTGANQSSKAMNTAIAGLWGGADIALEVTPDGINLNFDCAYGHIDGPIAPDSEGNFSVKGTYTSEHGGPMRSDENSDARPAIYKGKITGDKMTLTVTFPDGSVDVGPFNLERGKEGRIHKCM